MPNEHESHDEAPVPPVVVATTTIAVDRRLGRGGLGDVYVASDRDTGRSLAVKFLNGWAVSQQACREAFQFEATVTSQLEHPNIVPVYVTGATPDGKPFYAMRLIPGRTLAAAIAEFHGRHSGGDRSEQQAAAYAELLGQFALVCKAIAYAHDRGVVHRDIKPANIMLGKFGEVVVLDWGLAMQIDRDDRARSSGEQSIVMPTMAVDEPQVEHRGPSGTPAYMSPEQHHGAQRLGPASDIYGLGATLYHLLTGQPPFEGELAAIREQALAGGVVPLSRVKRGVSRTIEAVCLKAMARNPIDRYDSALDLARDVEHYLADLPVTACREPLLRTLARWTRRHRRVAQTALAGMLLLLLTAGTSAVLLRRMAGEESDARQTALMMAARLAASTAALHIDSCWRILELESEAPDLVEALDGLASASGTAAPVGSTAAARTGSGASGIAGRGRWAAVQLALDALAARNEGAADAESWTVCDAAGTIVARAPMADVIGQLASHRDYFHGGSIDLEPGTAMKPLTGLHCSTTYKSTVDGRLKVSFSTPVWRGRPGEEGRTCLGVLVMSFDVGSLFSSIDSIGGWNASRHAFSVSVIDLRDDLVEGTPQSGLILENPDLSHESRISRAEPQDDRAPAEVVAKLRQASAVRKASPDRRRHAAMSFADAEPSIAGAEPIVVLGRPEKLAHIGWAVIVHER